MLLRAHFKSDDYCESHHINPKSYNQDVPGLICCCHLHHAQLLRTSSLSLLLLVQMLFRAQYYCNDYCKDIQGILRQEEWQADCVFNVLEEIQAQLQGRQVRMLSDFCHSQLSGIA